MGFFTKIMGKLYKLSDYKKEEETDWVSYTKEIQALQIPDLLILMTELTDRLQKEGYTSYLRKKGIILFTEIEYCCQTEELRIMAKRMIRMLGQNE